MTTLYILELRGGKYYVGKTNDVTQRIQAHFSQDGSAWTQIYRPIRLLRTVPYTGPLSEDTLVKEMMLKHGIDAVRGGSYSNLELSEAQRSVLQKELRGAGDKCFHCGEKGHMASQCCSAEEEESDDDSEDDDDRCFRCGRPGHWAEDCYARWNVDGAYIID
jgi:predicted GIY-YIG superfamily endonuclease